MHVVWKTRDVPYEVPSNESESERMSHRYVVGVDECGTGALCGPVIVVAVAFSVDAERTSTMWKGIYADKTLLAGDSKGIKNEGHRAALSLAVQASCAAVVVIEKSSIEIDARLLSTVLPEAVQLAAARCLERLHAQDASLLPEDFLVLVDGDVEKPSLPCDVKCIPGGDHSDWRIGAASIVAKATHDQRMDALHKEYPNWGFDKSRGYPTKEHKALLANRGPTVAHRKSYKPVRDAMPRSKGIED